MRFQGLEPYSRSTICLLMGLSRPWCPWGVHDQYKLSPLDPKLPLGTSRMTIRHKLRKIATSWVITSSQTDAYPPISITTFFKIINEFFGALFSFRLLLALDSERHCLYAKQIHLRLWVEKCLHILSLKTGFMKSEDSKSAQQSRIKDSKLSRFVRPLQVLLGNYGRQEGFPEKSFSKSMKWLEMLLLGF